MSDQIDISREACEDHANYCRGFGPSTTPDLILALWAALDRAHAMRLPEVADAVDAERERCAVICEEQAQVFGSDEYATGQPMSSFKERFACESNAAAIRKG